jgi:hypothetical protein
VLQLTATMLLSVTVPYLLGMRKREPIFVALPFLFPFFFIAFNFSCFIT